MKGFFITFLILVLIAAVSLFLFAKSLSSKIDYDYKITKINPTGVFRGKLQIVLDLLIKNKSSIPIRISDLYIELYYKNELIAKTPSTIKENIVKSNADTTIKDFYLDLFLNDSSGEVVAKYLKKEAIDFEFVTKLKLFGIGLSLPKTKYTYEDYE